MRGCSAPYNAKTVQIVRQVWQHSALLELPIRSSSEIGVLLCGVGRTWGDGRQQQAAHRHVGIDVPVRHDALLLLQLPNVLDLPCACPVTQR